MPPSASGKRIQHGAAFRLEVEAPKQPEATIRIRPGALLPNTTPPASHGPTRLISPLMTLSARGNWSRRPVPRKTGDVDFGGIHDPGAALDRVWPACAIRPALRSIRGVGILSVLLHSFVDYPMPKPAVAFWLFVLLGAVMGMGKHRRGRSPPAMRKTVS